MSPLPRRALVIGASGFLGSRLLALGPQDTDLLGTGHRRPVRPGRWREVVLDVTSTSAVTALLERERPEAVIYAAYDLTAHDVTVDGAAAAARAAARAGARFAFVSTDLVFDGARGNYAERDLARPILPYGARKLEAEGHVRHAHPEAVILRSALMVGVSGDHQRPAFEVETLRERRPAPLFADEWRSPIHVDDVARAVWDLLAREVGGVFHWGGPDRLTRLELGRLVCAWYGFDPALLREARRPLDRPRDVSLNSARLTALLGWKPRSLIGTSAASLPAGV